MFLKLARDFACSFSCTFYVIFYKKSSFKGFIRKKNTSTENVGEVGWGGGGGGSGNTPSVLPAPEVLESYEQTKPN